MRLTRTYKQIKGWQPVRNTRDELGRLKDRTRPERAILNPPPIDFITIEYTGTNPEQHFTEKLVRAGQREGFLAITGNTLSLIATPEDLEYTIKRYPGYYCCHCGAELPDAGVMETDEDGKETGRTLGLVHVEEQHEGAVSPDPSNPSGYERLDYYDCILNKEQHERFRFVGKNKAGG